MTAGDMPYSTCPIQPMYSQVPLQHDPIHHIVYNTAMTDSEHKWKLTKSWWRHQMETFSALLALCAGNSPVPVNSPHKGQWRRALMFSLICARINDWVNNREAGDLRRYRGHYDVNVMSHPHRLAIGCLLWKFWRKLTSSWLIEAERHICAPVN